MERFSSSPGDAAAAHLCVPEILTPEQVRAGPQESGETRLRRAILVDGLLCWLGIGIYLERNPRSRARLRLREQARAEKWIASRGRSAFAFETICDVLELNPQAIREGLHRPHLRVISNPQALAWRRRTKVRTHNQVCKPRHRNRLAKGAA